MSPGVAVSPEFAAAAAVPFNLVPQITTPLMLLALAAVLLYGYRMYTVRAATERLKHVPEDRRYDLVDQLAGKYGVPVKDLSPEDRARIVNGELLARRESDRRKTWLVFFAFALTAVLWFLSVMPDTGRLAADDSPPVTGSDSTEVSTTAAERRDVALRREDGSLPFPGTVCQGNPALPPSDGCVALLGGARPDQTLVFDVPEVGQGLRAASATLYLRGLFDGSSARKPSCLAVSIDNRAVPGTIPLTFGRISLSGQLSDEPEVSTTGVPLPGEMAARLGPGRHRANLRIPPECAAEGFVALRDAYVSLEWQ